MRKEFWRKGYRCPRGSDTGEHFTLKELLEIFHYIQSTKNKVLEVDPNLEKNETIYLIL